MHIVIKDPETGKEEGILCIERRAGFGIILFASPKTLGTLLDIAKSQKLPYVYLIVEEQDVETLEAQGWRETTSNVLMYHE